MATFVLVHGGWHGGWCWRDVAARLVAAGHVAHAPTLTGLGERAHLLTPAVDLALHVEDLASHLAYEDLRGVTLVGHSYAGMVITALAERAADRLAALVYLDAFVPADGQCLLDILPPARRAYYEQQAREHGDGWRVPPPPPAAFGLADLAAIARLTPQPLATLTGPVRLADPRAAAVPRAYIHCTDGPMAGSFAPFAARAQADPAWRFATLATAHDAMLTAPAALAALLLDIAAPGPARAARPAP